MADTVSAFLYSGFFWKSEEFSRVDESSICTSVWCKGETSVFSCLYKLAQTQVLKEGWSFWAYCEVSVYEMLHRRH